MAPQALRQPTRKAAAVLPQSVKFNFLLEASKAYAGTCAALSAHLGYAALQVRQDFATVRVERRNRRGKAGG